MSVKERENKRMCGIYGFSLNDKTGSSLAGQQRIILHAVMGAAMEERGNHAYGYVARYAVAENGKGLQTRKRTGPLSAGARKLMTVAATAYQIVVHTRYATHGDTSKRNSHPFTQGNIVGVHNGIISNHEALNRQHGRSYSVDSQHIFQHLADGLPLNELTGYGAIVYTYDGTPEHGDTLYLGKFNGGELAMARVYAPGSKQSFGVVFASTRSAVENACAVAGIELEFLRVDDGTLYSVEAGRAYTVAAGLLDVGEGSGKQDRRTSGGRYGYDYASWDSALGGNYGAGYGTGTGTGSGKSSGYSWETDATTTADDDGGELDDNGNTVAMFGRVLGDCTVCGCFAHQHAEDFCTECGYQCSDMYDGGNSELQTDDDIRRDDTYDEVVQDAALAELVSRMTAAGSGSGT